MTRTSPATLDAVKAIAALCKQGRTRNQIAERLGMKYEAVCDLMKRFGLNAPRHKSKRERPPELVKRDADIVKQIRAGTHAAEVAKQYGIGMSRVIAIAEMNGIKLQDITRSLAKGSKGRRRG